jgi:hypothetical protein
VEEKIMCDKCDDFLGVLTDNGLIVGNIIVKSEEIICGCGEIKDLELVLDKFEEIC